MTPSYPDPSANWRSDSFLGVSGSGGFSDLPTTYSSDGVSAHRIPLAAPRLTSQSQSDPMQAQNRCWASPSSRPSKRSTRYNTDGSRNTTRWPTSFHSVVGSRRRPPFGYGHLPESDMLSQILPLQAPGSYAVTSDMPHSVISQAGGTTPMQTSYVHSMASGGDRNSTTMMPPHLSHPPPISYGMHHGTYDLGLPLSPTLASHSLLELLQNSAEPLPLNNYYADLPASVDLYLALLEKPAPPPPEDLKPSDPDLIPHKQEPRFEGDMHTPKWVRGHGEKREGWCGLCKPGRWLVLKTSAYWYHKAFTHGISAATGAPFQGPLDKRRIDGKMDVWEGLCGNCNTWIRLFGRKKKGTAWFRHTYKCRSPAKVKDTPKLKRDRAHNVGMPRPHLSPIGLAGMYDQQRVQSTTPTTLSHGLAPAWYAAMADGDGIYPSIPQYMHPLQQHPHHHEPTIGLLKPP